MSHSAYPRCLQTWGSDASHPLYSCSVFGVFLLCTLYFTNMQSPLYETCLRFSLLTVPHLLFLLLHLLLFLMPPQLLSSFNFPSVSEDLDPSIDDSLLCKCFLLYIREFFYIESVQNDSLF